MVIAMYVTCRNINSESIMLKLQIRGMIQIEYRGRTEQDKEIVLDGAEFICYLVGERAWRSMEVDKSF